MPLLALESQRQALGALAAFADEDAGQAPPPREERAVLLIVMPPSFARDF
jgi:hypothetical protein